MIGIDTSILVRYLTQDDPAQAAAATRFIERTLGAGLRGHVSLVTLAELTWVLRTRYNVDREAMSDALLRILADGRLVIQDAAAAWVALDSFRTPGVDFADALICAVDQQHGCTHTVTFDRKALRIPGMAPIQ